LKIDLLARHGELRHLIEQGNGCQYNNRKPFMDRANFEKTVLKLCPSLEVRAPIMYEFLEQYVVNGRDGFDDLLISLIQASYETHLHLRLSCGR
jgi:hypothetical protein